MERTAWAWIVSLHSLLRNYVRSQ